MDNLTLSHPVRPRDATHTCLDGCLHQPDQQYCVQESGLLRKESDREPHSCSVSNPNTTGSQSSRKRAFADFGTTTPACQGVMPDDLMISLDDLQFGSDTSRNQSNGRPVALHRKNTSHPHFPRIIEPEPPVMESTTEDIKLILKGLDDTLADSGKLHLLDVADEPRPLASQTSITQRQLPRVRQGLISPDDHGVPRQKSIQEVPLSATFDRLGSAVPGWGVPLDLELQMDLGPFHHDNVSLLSAPRLGGTPLGGFQRQSRALSARMLTLSPRDLVGGSGGNNNSSSCGGGGGATFQRMCGSAGGGNTLPDQGSTALDLEMCDLMLTSNPSPQDMVQRFSVNTTTVSLDRSIHGPAQANGEGVMLGMPVSPLQLWQPPMTPLDAHSLPGNQLESACSCYSGAYPALQNDLTPQPPSQQQLPLQYGLRNAAMGPIWSCPHPRLLQQLCSHNVAQQEGQPQSQQLLLQTQQPHFQRHDQAYICTASSTPVSCPSYHPLSLADVAPKASFLNRGASISQWAASPCRALPSKHQSQPWQAQPQGSLDSPTPIPGHAPALSCLPRRPVIDDGAAEGWGAEDIRTSRCQVAPSKSLVWQPSCGTAGLVTGPEGCSTLEWDQRHPPPGPGTPLHSTQMVYSAVEERSILRTHHMCRGSGMKDHESPSQVVAPSRHVTETGLLSSQAAGRRVLSTSSLPTPCVMTPTAERGTVQSGECSDLKSCSTRSQCHPQLGLMPGAPAAAVGNGRVWESGHEPCSGDGYMAAANTAGRSGRPRQRNRTVSTLADIIRLNLLCAGQHRLLVGNQDFVDVTLTSDGRIKSRLGEFRSLSSMALTVLRQRNPNRMACDGWQEVRLNGQRLDELRQEAVKLLVRESNDTGVGKGQ